MNRFLLEIICCLGLVGCGRQKSAAENQAEIQNKAPSGEKEKSKSESNAVEMTSEAQQRAGVAVAPVTTVPMTQFLRVTGSVQPVDSSIAHVRPLSRGRLQEVRVKLGDRVSSGQVLAQLDNIEAGEFIAQYNAARSERQ